MGWFAFVDGYCERLDVGLWAEPLNFITNAGFLAMALWLWPRVKLVAGARALVVLLAAIGLGSGLFSQCGPALGRDCRYGANFTVCAHVYISGKPAILAFVTWLVMRSAYAIFPLFGTCFLALERLHMVG